MKAHSKISALVSMIVLFLSVGLIQAKTDRVAVKAFATDDYTVVRARDKSKKVQTYFIAEGKFYPGNSGRPGMEAVTFMDIAQDLSFNLKRRNFFSETNQGKGDLLIVAHYGVTDYDTDYMELNSINSIDDFGYGSIEVDDPLLQSAVREEFQGQVFDMQSINEGNAQAQGVKARLFGMDELFSITASDLQINDLRKMLWSTRYSMSAKDKSFDQAIAEMNFVAGDFFGQNRKGLNFKRSSDKSDVKLGEVEVIESQTN